MALLYLVLALVIQGSLANQTSSEEIVENRDVLKNKPIEDEDNKEQPAEFEWINFFPLPDASMYPTSSLAMMTQATNSDKPLEEQLEEIKDVAHKITLAIQSEMANLLTYALSTVEKEEEESNSLRKRRSVESPMDSSQLINRLLRHIKANNEYQNIAIEKMMTAQEIADKYGIEFRPDTEILSDLAFAANQHAKDMNNLLQDTVEMKNLTANAGNMSDNEVNHFNDAQTSPSALAPIQTCPHKEQQNHQVHSHQGVNHYHYADSYPNYNYYYNYPHETQIPPPPVQTHYNAPVTKRPNFYDAVYFTPEEYYPPYCSMEPMSMASSIILPFEEILEPEPELVGEEFEETVTSKVYVDRGDEPGSATVNHVMTYTVAEKSHFKTPEIERLPEQMQYCFFLI